MSKPIIAPSVLKELLSYEPETGALYWRPRGLKWFNHGKRPRELMGKIWNTKYAGKRALTCKNAGGYLHGGIMGKSYFAHRVVWAMDSGAWPDAEIDHLDHDKGNNRVENLRLVSRIENQRNRPLQYDNKSGVAGVGWVARDNRWYARIGVNYECIHLGYFVSKGEAIVARKRAEEKYGFLSSEQPL